jgi:hypothetical protein
MIEIEATEISVDDSGEEDFDLPSYGEYGKIIVEVLGKIDSPFHPYWQWEIDRYTYEGSAFWINEGMGMDYFINDYIREDIPGAGIWTIDDIKGTYFKGEWGFTDDDEEWEWSDIRPATQDEINEI